MLKPENWRVNSSGDTEIFYDAAEKAIAFRTRFAPGTRERWSYPEFLLQLPHESQKDLLGIAFEVKVFRAADIGGMALMAVRSPGTMRTATTGSSASRLRRGVGGALCLLPDAAPEAGEGAAAPHRSERALRRRYRLSSQYPFHL